MSDHEATHRISTARRAVAAVLVVGAFLAACATPPQPTAIKAVPSTTIAPTASPVGTPASLPRATATPAASTTPAPSSIGDLVADGAAGVLFDRPAAWVRWQPNRFWPTSGGPLIYLSTEPKLPSCAVEPTASPNPPDARGRACDWPIRSLSPGGVLVTWSSTRPPLWLPKAGEPITVNGERTYLTVERPGRCADIGGDETIWTRIPQGQRGRMSDLDLMVCLRGPGLETTEAAVRAMLVSTTVRR